MLDEGAVAQQFQHCVEIASFTRVVQSVRHFRISLVRFCDSSIRFVSLIKSSNEFWREAQQTNAQTEKKKTKVFKTKTRTTLRFKRKKKAFSPQFSFHGKEKIV